MFGWIGYLADATLFTGGVITGKKHWAGWAINFTGCGIFFAYGALTNSGPVMVAEVGFGALALYNLRKWLKK